MGTNIIIGGTVAAVAFRAGQITGRMQARRP